MFMCQKSGYRRLGVSCPYTGDSHRYGYKYTSMSQFIKLQFKSIAVDWEPVSYLNFTGRITPVTSLVLINFNGQCVSPYLFTRITSIFL